MGAFGSFGEVILGVGGPFLITWEVIFLKFLTKWATELRTLTDFVRKQEVMACRQLNLNKKRM